MQQALHTSILRACQSRRCVRHWRGRPGSEDKYRQKGFHQRYERSQYDKRDFRIRQCGLEELPECHKGQNSGKQFPLVLCSECFQKNRGGEPAGHGYDGIRPQFLRARERINQLCHGLPDTAVVRMLRQDRRDARNGLFRQSHHDRRQWQHAPQPVSHRHEYPASGLPVLCQ